VGCGLGGEGFWFGVGYYTCIVSTETLVAYVNAPGPPYEIRTVNFGGFYAAIFAA